MPTEYYLPKILIRGFNIITDTTNVIGESFRNCIKTYAIITGTATGQRDGSTIGCLFDHLYFKEN